MIKFGYWGESHAGLVRKRNEDDVIGIEVKNTLFLAVADGFGVSDDKVGANLTAGVVVANEIKRYIELFYLGGNNDYIKHFITECLYVANRVMMAFKKANFTEYSGYGSSITICAITPSKEIVVGHLGNTRFYLLRAGQVIQGTVDHTFAQKYLDEGKITKQEYMKHPERATLNNGLGYSEDLNAIVYNETLLTNDLILLLSDGVYNLINEEEILGIIARNGTLEGSMKALVQTSIDRGGFDNASALASFIDF